MQDDPPANRTICPSCGSSHTRRGGAVVWAVYLALLALAIPMVLVWRFNAAIVAAVMLGAIALTHLVVRQRVCLDCGEQFGGGAGRTG